MDKHFQFNLQLDVHIHCTCMYFAAMIPGTKDKLSIIIPKQHQTHSDISDCMSLLQHVHMTIPSVTTPTSDCIPLLQHVQVIVYLCYNMYK